MPQRERRCSDQGLSGQSELAFGRVQNCQSNLVLGDALNRSRLARWFWDTELVEHRIVSLSKESVLILVNPAHQDRSIQRQTEITGDIGLRQSLERKCPSEVLGGRGVDKRVFVVELGRIAQWSEVAAGDGHG
jgi:hypothetical protein